MKFGLVFFYDILIYNKSWKEQVQHVGLILELLEKQQVYANHSKCVVGFPEVEYLGHFVSHKGIKVDPNKIKTMVEWIIPKIVKIIKGFL